MSRHELAAAQIIDELGALSIVEVLACFRVDRNELSAMIEVGVLEPQGSVEDWRFASRDLRRLRAAQRLIQDLEVNLSGAAVILDLIEERDRLRKQIHDLQRLLDDSI